MKKNLRKIFLSFLITTMLVCSLGLYAFAAEENSDVSNSMRSVSENIGADDSREESSYVDEEEISPARGQVSVYNDIETRIYTGKGVNRWLHITPWVTPNYLTIRMVDYQGHQVWKQSFNTTGTTHWFVGSNVKYVYLKGRPGGVVNVTDSAN